MSSLVIIPLKHVSTSTFYDKIYSESAPFCLFLLIIQTSNDYHHFIMIVISSWPIFCFKFYTVVYLWYDDHGRNIHLVLFCFFIVGTVTAFWKSASASSHTCRFCFQFKIIVDYKNKKIWWSLGSRRPPGHQAGFGNTYHCDISRQERFFLSR